MALVDESGTGTLDFNSFFRLICLYCYFSEEDILSFCFQTFDKDASGQVGRSVRLRACCCFWWWSRPPKTCRGRRQ